MSTTLRPWLEYVDLHPDVLSDDFSEDVFALDLGALSDYLVWQDLGSAGANLPRVPAVYRDADGFFSASFLTSGLRALLEDVLWSYPDSVDRLARVSHQLPAAAANLLAVAGRTPRFALRQATSTAKREAKGRLRLQCLSVRAVYYRGILAPSRRKLVRNPG